MTQANQDSPFVVLVTFETTSENQQEALISIRDYIASFLSQQPGFVRSTLHKSHDSKSVMHYAHWETGQDFKNFSLQAKDHPAIPKLLQYKPSPSFYEITETF